MTFQPKLLVFYEKKNETGQESREKCIFSLFRSSICLAVPTHNKPLLCKYWVSTWAAEIIRLLRNMCTLPMSPADLKNRTRLLSRQSILIGRQSISDTKALHA